MDERGGVVCFVFQEAAGTTGANATLNLGELSTGI
jgi:hypothetical protein